MKKSNHHIPVLVEQVVQFLITDPSGIYVDGTVGGGGHSFEILKRLTKNGYLIGIDWDDDALEIANQRLAQFENRYKLIKNNFAQIQSILTDEKIEHVDGILLDLGISSFQIDNPNRGFSYLKNGELDMRMSDLIQKPAAEILHAASEDELARIFYKYGEERHSRAIARAIVKNREKPLKTTAQLSQIVESVVPYKFRIKSLARIYQAIRIFTNFEIDNLKQFLGDVMDVVKVGGRIVIIAFHSLEDRLVKEFFKKQANPCECPPNFPVCVCDKKPKVKILTRKVVVPSDEEAKKNPRSRSAKLRACEILGDD